MRPDSFSRASASAARACASWAVSSFRFVWACSRSKRLPAPVDTSSVFCATRLRIRSRDADVAATFSLACFNCWPSWRSPECALVNFACTSARRCRSAPTLASSEISFASSEFTSF